MRRVRRWVATGACAVMAVSVSACGGSSSGGSGGSAGGVLDGLSALASAQSLTTTVHLAVAPQTLRDFFHNSGQPVTPATAHSLTGASVVIEMLKTGSATNVDLQVREGSKALVELRSVNDSLYLQGDVRGILTLFHKSNVFANLKARTKSMPSFVQAIISGQWVSLPQAAMSSLAQAGGASTSATAGNGPKLLADLRDVIKRDVTIASAGIDARGHHYTLTADQNTLATDLRSSLAADVPGGALAGQRLPSNVAHRNITLDAWVKDGVLSTLSINVAQFAKPSVADASGPVPVTIDFARNGAPITAPSGAVPVDLTQLGTHVGALSGGSQ